MKQTTLDWLTRQLGLGALARRLLAVEHLQDGQRRDFDALAPVLQAKDGETSALRAEVAGLRAQLEQVVAGANEAIGNLNLRLSHYESTIPAIAGQRRALIARIKRENKARAAAEALAGPIVPSAGEGAESEAELAAEGPSGLTEASA